MVGLGPESQLTASGARPFSTRISFLFKIAEVVPAHKDLRPIAVEVAQHLSRTKDSVYFTSCGNGRCKRCEEAGE